MKRDERLVRLSREHTHALLLAQRLTRGLPEASDEEAVTLYSTTISFWSAGLLPHFRAEGECLLARLIRHVPDEDERVQRLHRDHLRLEGFVASMRDSDDVAERRRLLAEFAATLRTHVRWEEETLFPATESILGEGELDALGDELAERLPETPLPFWEAGGAEPT
jgi:hemerythrin-like domain-containing protein